MVVLLFTILASTIFTCRSYEYQILLAKPFIIGIIFAHPIEWYPHGDVTAGINWVDKEPHQGTQERSWRGEQLPISSSPSSHRLLSKPLSTPSPLNTPLLSPSLCRSSPHLLWPPTPPFICRLSLRRNESTLSIISEEVQQWETSSNLLLSLLPSAVVHFFGQSYLRMMMKVRHLDQQDSTSGFEDL